MDTEATDHIPVDRPSEDLDAILDVMITGMVATDERFTVRWFNRAAGEFFPPLETGRTMYDLLGAISHEQKVDRVLLRRERVVFELDGDLPTLEWQACPGRLPDGGHLILCWPTVWIDEMLDRRADFSIGAFHELRTPLTALLGFGELLEIESEGMTPSQKEAVEVIVTTARRLVGLTDDLFDLTRNSFGELRLDLGPVDLASVVTSVLRVYRAERCHHLDLRIEPGLPAVEADEARVRQVIDNLVSNACRHNPGGTRVEVSLRRAAGGVELEIRDHGDGLGFDDPEDAFRAFKRSESAIQSGRDGSGVGLPLAKRLVELHRGRLTLENPAGSGTSARVWLPLERDGALEPGEPGPA